jgi:hypothetical protein
LRKRILKEGNAGEAGMKKGDINGELLSSQRVRDTLMFELEAVLDKERRGCR